MEAKYSEVCVSFVVTSLADSRLLRLMSSFVAMKDAHLAELIVVLGTVPDAFREQVETGAANLGEGIRVLVAEGRSRCYRKDLGVQAARSRVVGFVDSDCVFDQSYLSEILGEQNHPIIRGRTIFDPGVTWVSRMNSFYRTLCDQVFFREETFSPNLLLSKDLLHKVGGWAEQSNLDEQDDFILSQRIKQFSGEQVHHVDSAVIVHDADGSFQKLVPTWFGYGLGYGFRYWRVASRWDLKLLRWFVPPLVCMRQMSVDYWLFSSVQWICATAGYLAGLSRYRFGTSTGALK